MASQQPFTWGLGGQKITTPEQAERQRKIAAALIDRPASENWAQGLGSITAALASNAIGDRVGQAETEGRGRAGALFADLAVNSDPNAIIAALTSPDSAWASPSQTSIASALLSSGLDRADPAYQLDMQLKQAQLAAAQAPAQPDYPTSVEEYLYAQDNPGFAAWQAENGGGQTINVGGDGQRMGTVPPGYAAVQDPSNPSGYRLEPIPGGPAANEIADNAAAGVVDDGKKDTATGIIVGAAQNARKVLDSGGVTTGTLGQIFSGAPETQAAELRRQVEVLTANAKIENLAAMRASSPTGAALGAVSDTENAMLAAATGALDPNASKEDFARALDNYEKVLLQIVHGPEQGARIYSETRPKSSERSTANGVTFRIVP